MKYLKAQQQLDRGMVKYLFKRKSRGWSLVTVDGREMRRTRYLNLRKRELTLFVARYFGAEVYQDWVFVDPRTALRSGHLWSGGPLSSLDQAMPD